MTKNMPRGSAHTNSKLTDELVVELRRNWGRFSHKKRHELAKLFNVSITTLRDAVTGKTWKHVSEPTVPSAPRKSLKPRAKLTPELVKKIRRVWPKLKKHGSKKEFLENFEQPISRATAQDICNRRTWKEYK